MRAVRSGSTRGLWSLKNTTFRDEQALSPSHGFEVIFHQDTQKTGDRSRPQIG